ncbi:MAG: hypothetical protein FD164_2373, partial [Nitrospirae bacterium]
MSKILSLLFLFVLLLAPVVDSAEESA